MSKKVVGRVEATNEEETTNGEKFGVKIKSEDSENWYNGFGSLPSGVEEGAKIQLQYEINEHKGNLYRNIKDKDAIDVLEEAEDSSSSSSSSGGQDSESYDRQNAVKAVGRIFQGVGSPNAEQLQMMKTLVEEFEEFNSSGEFSRMEDLIIALTENQEDLESDSGSSKSEGVNPAEEEDSEVSDSENDSEGSKEESVSEEEDEPEEGKGSEGVDSDKPIQKEMKQAVKDKQGSDVIFGDDDSEE